MALTRVVVAAVPRVAYSETAVLPEGLALKSSCPRMTVSEPGNDPPLPGFRSATGTVPPDVPSVFHSSLPVVPSLALKYTAPAYEVNPPGAKELVTKLCRLIV